MPDPMCGKCLKIKRVRCKCPEGTVGSLREFPPNPKLQTKKKAAKDANEAPTNANTTEATEANAPTKDTEEQPNKDEEPNGKEPECKKTRTHADDSNTWASGGQWTTKGAKWTTKGEQWASGGQWTTRGGWNSKEEWTPKGRQCDRKKVIVCPPYAHEAEQHSFLRTALFLLSNTFPRIPEERARAWKAWYRRFLVLPLDSSYVANLTDIDPEQGKFLADSDLENFVTSGLYAAMYLKRHVQRHLMSVSEKECIKTCRHPPPALDKFRQEVVGNAMS